MPRRSASKDAPSADGASLPNIQHDDDSVTATSQTVAAGQLRAFIERIERLEEEKKTIGDDIKEVFAEAKGTGFDTTIMRQLIKLRGMDQAERQERENVLDLYKAALGMV